MKKVAIIGTAGVPANYGGFETLAQNLIKNLKDEFEFTVYCSKKHYPKKRRVAEIHQAKLIYLPFKANGCQSIIYDIISMIHAIFYCDTLLILGVSGGLFIPFLKLFTNTNIILNLDGLEWKRQKWNFCTKLFLKISEYIAVKKSDKIITDNQVLKEYLNHKYKRSGSLIEYGGDYLLNETLENNYLQTHNLTKGNYALKIARIEPENNIHIILSAFSKSHKKLMIIGNWSTSNYGKTLKKKYSDFKNISINEPIYDRKILNALLLGSEVYIHGHSAGGTNPSLVEAMCLKLPVIAFDVNFNRETTENKGYYFKDEESLTKTILNLTSLDLISNGNSMHEISLRRYKWNRISELYKNLINEI
tara:strand:- start:1057 stop:2142 length:1086 start_codon:yes stop_codon:yes gene_type:complete